MSRPFNSPDVFRAIAHPARRRILDLLRGGDLTPGDLASHFRITKPAVSLHLRALRQAGLVQEHRNGLRLLYSLSPKALGPVSTWIAPFQARMAPPARSR